MATIGNLQKIRKDKLEALKKLGVDPYPAEVGRREVISQVLDKEGAEAVIVGRVIGLRGHGKIIFVDLVDETGKIQAVFKADTIPPSSFKILEYIDLGDFLTVAGKVGKTQAGEISIFATNLKLIAKSLRPLPDQWSGLKDIEERYRQRYVDLLMNRDVREVFMKRSRVIKFLREYLDKEGFLEVETPVLQPIYGGASARPFITHHNALDTDLYLRISDELYLKRLIVGGFEKVYEIGHDFRNEGMDRGHNPEFTMLEFYWAYANYERLMEFTEGMFAALLTEISGTLTLEYQGQKLDFTPPWRRVTYREALLEHTGIDIDVADSEEKLKQALKKKEIMLATKGVAGYGGLLDVLYKQTTRPHLIGPLFLTERPTAFVSLAKRLPQDPRKTASFQLLVGGEELINAYNELNDPIDQANRWRESEKLGKKGQVEHEAFDADYIRALEYGMPPTAGWGLGIDRLVAILTNQRTIKDVILFPTLRPEK
ncbi:MAG: lysine--tRNA ligase [Patescibacteria group bacterium]